MSELRVLLIGNYPPDGQESMQRFVQVLHQGLAAQGHEVRVIRPEQRLGGGQTSLGKWLGYLDKLVLFPSQLKKALRQECANHNKSLVSHICDHSNSVYARHLWKVPHVITCHDLIAIRSALGEFPEIPTRWSGRHLQQMILSGLNLAQHVAAVSEGTRRDLLRLSSLREEQVEVVPMGLNYPYAPLSRTASEPWLARVLPCATCRDQANPNPFLLHVGGNQWYKNRLGVLRIYRSLVDMEPEAPHLVLAGKPVCAEMQRFMAEHSLISRIHVVEGCDNETLRALYSRAALLLFPSLVEGFGWPAIEAQACGCRVVVSDRPALNEIAGAAAVLIDPEQPQAAAGRVRELLQEANPARENRIQRGLLHALNYSTDGMIQQYLALYQRQLSA